jgi:hypothetical protein
MRRELLPLGIAVLLTSLGLGLIVHQSSVGQSPGQAAITANKYQAALGVDAHGNVAVLLCDTSNGNLWLYSNQDKQWRELPSPLPKAKQQTNGKHRSHEPESR